MSVVRKYQSGEKLPNQNEYSDFQDFLSQKMNKEASKGAFTSKGEKALRDQAFTWVEGAKKGLFDKDEQGNYKYYSTDNLHNTYSINPKDNTELSALDLTGHDEQIKPNLFGQLNLDKKKANTWIANARLEYEAQKGAQGATTSSGDSPTNQEVDFGPLENYMREVVYHKNDNWGNAWQDLTSGLDEKGMQKKIGETYKGYLDWHINKMKAPQKGVHYGSIDNQEELYGITSKIASGDFTPEEYKKFKDLGSRYGTDFSTFYTPKTAEQIAAEAQQKTTEASAAYVKELTEQGIVPEFAEQIAIKNWKVGKLKDDLPAHVTKFITDNGGIVIDMPDGKQLISNKQGQILPSHDFTDPDDGNATYFTNDAQGFNYFAPGTKGYTSSRFQDPTGTALDLRPIIGSFSNYEGYKIYGVPNPLPNGTRDYTKHLHLRDPNSDKTFDLFKKGDTPGVYQDSKGIEFSGELTDWGAYNPQEEGVQISLQSHPEFVKKYDKLPAVKKDDIDLDIDTTTYIGRTNIEEVKSTLSGLKYIMEHEEEYPDLDTQNKAHRRYWDILKELESDDKYTSIREKLLGTNNSSDSSDSEWSFGSLSDIFKKEKGGILKYQQGSKSRKLTLDEYNALYNPKQATTEITNDPTKRGIRSSVGTLRDMNALDAISLTGSVASIVPVIGAFGAGVTTVADAINDYSDGDFSGKDWGNLGMNLGFTALSAVGFGTLGTAAKAAKLAKIADTAMDAAKVAKIGLAGVDDMAKLSKPLQEGLELMAGGARTFKEAKLTATELKELKGLKDAAGTLIHPELSSVKSIVGKIPDTFKSKITKIAEEVVEEAPKVLPKDPSAWQREFSGVINAGKYLRGLTTLPTVAKVAGKTLGGLGALNAGYSATKVAGNVLSGNGLDTQVNDLKNAAFLTSGIRGLVKTRPMANLAKQMNTAEGEARQLLTIGKSTYAVDAKANKDIVKESLEKLQGFKKLKEKTRLRGTNADNIKANEETAKQYKEHLSKILGKELDDDIIKSLMGEKASIMSTNRTAADLGVSQREFDRAKAFSEGKINYWRGRNYWNLKQGGILKAWSGNKLPFDSAISKSYQYDKGYVDYVMGLDQKWFDDNQGAIKQAAGNYQVKDLAHLKYLGTDNQYGPIHKLLDFNWQNSDAGNGRGPVATDNDVKAADAAVTTAQPTAATTNTEVPVTASSKPKVEPDFIGENRFKWPKIDKNDLYNLAGYLGANSATNRAIDLQRKAAYANLYSLPFMSRQYMRTSAPNQMFYDKQATGVQNMAGNMAKATSDLDQGAGFLFAGADRGIGMREKGYLMDSEVKQKGIQQQMESDQKVDQYNTQVYGKNKAMAADAAGKQFTFTAAGTIAKSQNFQNYLQQLNRSDQIKQQEKKYQNYYALATDPKVTGIYDEMNNLNEEHQKAKENWDKTQENTELAKKIAWETTNEYKKFNDRMKVFNLQMQGNQRQLYNASLAMQMPGNVGYSKKGGSLDLEDKKELIRYQHEMKKQDNELETFYKVILKNNELMYKSLARIFK